MGTLLTDKTEMDRVRGSILILARSLNKVIRSIDTLSHEYFDTGAKPGRTGSAHPLTEELYEASVLINDAIKELWGQDGK